MKRVYLTDEQHQQVLDALRQRAYQLAVFGPFRPDRKALSAYLDGLRKMIEQAPDLPLAHQTDAQPTACRYQSGGAPCVYWCGNEECMK